MVDVIMGLKRAQLEKVPVGRCLKEAPTQEAACVALSKELVAWMKKTKYEFASCSVDPAGKTDFKVTIKLAKKAKETDAEEIRSYITGHSRH